MKSPRAATELNIATLDTRVRIQHDKSYMTLHLHRLQAIVNGLVLPS